MRHYMTAFSLVLLLAAAGCKTTETPLVGKALDSLTGQHDAVEKRLATAAANSISEGKTDEALAHYEQLYTHPNLAIFKTANYRNEDIALNYAQLLRKTGKAQRALTVLSPLAETRTGKLKHNTAPIVLNELAAIHIELGNFEKAESILNEVLENKRSMDFHADASNLMGISLDAQGKHKEAEKSLRQALSGWKGDSTSVMNNLAVCLASQGLFDESLTTLRQALVMAPDKHEIARNIEIVTEISQSLLPKPGKQK